MFRATMIHAFFLLITRFSYLGGLFNKNPKPNILARKNINRLMREKFLNIIEKLSFV